MYGLRWVLDLWRDHSESYINVQPLCYAPETNRILNVNCNLKKDLVSV